MSLTLIGLGLHSERDVSLLGIEKAKRSGKVYIELYTGRWYGNIQSLEKLIGKKVTEVKRKDLEDNSKKIIDEAKNKDIVIFIEGDPLVQTTHSSLLLDAKKNGIETRIIHNASIVSAIAECGLHLQKFGQYLTIPFPEKTKNKKPKSIFEIIKRNKEYGLHTLCFLDMKTEEDKYMTVTEGLKILLSGGVINNNEKVIAFAKAGSNKPLIIYDTVDKLVKKNINDIPAVIIIPRKLHFTEEEFLRN